MKRSRLLVLSILGPAFAPLIAGCGDPKEIQQLKEENARLNSELDAAKAEAASALEERDVARQKLDDAERLIASLQQQLAEKPQVIRVPEVRTVEPKLPEGWKEVPGGAMIAVEGQVLFDSGKAVLRKEARSTLDKIASAIKTQFADKDIYVIGHTDNEPIKKSGWKDNRELSAERALAVVRDLGNHGISPSKLVACGWGEHKPVAPNSSAGNRSKNRRVEVYAVSYEMKSGGR